MYARLVTSQLHPGTMDEVVQIFHDSVVPDSKQQPGFQGAMALVDRSANKTISITLWETEAEAMTTATGGHLEAQMNKFASHLAAPPVVETFEVPVHE
jgi:heme-degrading monooxygenase HmoA